MKQNPILNQVWWYLSIIRVVRKQRGYPRLHSKFKKINLGYNRSSLKNKNKNKKNKTKQKKPSRTREAEAEIGRSWIQGLFGLQIKFKSLGNLK